VSRVLIRGARQLLTLRGPGRARRGAEMQDLGLIEDGALLIEHGVILEAGVARRVENLAAAKKAKVIDATGRVVMPGFFDAHAHPVAGPARVTDFEARPVGAPDADMVRREFMASVRAVRGLPGSALEVMAGQRLMTALRHGTTGMMAKTGFGLDAAAEIKSLRVLGHLTSPVEVAPVYRAGYGPAEAVFLAEVAGPVLARAAKQKLAVAAAVRCDDADFARSFAALARAVGLPVQVEGGPEAVRLAEELGAWPITLTEPAAPSGEAAGGVVTFVPAAELHLRRGEWPDARAWVDCGAAVALGSGGNPVTAPGLNMGLAMGLAVARLGMTAAQAVTAATVNGAWAAGRGHRCGSLEPGKQADVLMLDAADYRELGYYLGTNLVVWTMKKGQIVAGEGAP